MRWSLTWFVVKLVAVVVAADMYYDRFGDRGLIAAGATVVAAAVVFVLVAAVMEIRNPTEICDHQANAREREERIERIEELGRLLMESRTERVT